MEGVDLAATTAMYNMDKHSNTCGANCQRYYHADAVRRLRDQLLQQKFTAAGYRALMACDLLLCGMTDDNGGSCGK
jgi:hypothetical protein